MLFSRKKRTQRDRDAGLVFCWRGQGGNRGGFMLAVLIASAMYAGAFWGLSLRFNNVPSEPKKSAKILLLDTLSPEMTLWVDQNSPFPVRWDPMSYAEHQTRVQNALNSTLQDIMEPASQWREMPKSDSELSTPRLIEAGTVELGNLPHKPARAAGLQEVELVIALDALGALQKRLPKKITSFDTAIPRHKYGSNQRFAITLDAEGRVSHCAPIDWQEGEYARGVENWLRSQQFLPSQTSLEAGEVIINVEAKEHAGD